jgi:hypothetical protein
MVIILIMTAISIPKFLRSKMSADEASSVGSLRTLNGPCVTYSTFYSGYPSFLSVIGGEGTPANPTPTSAELIDDVLQTGLKTG